MEPQKNLASILRESAHKCFLAGLGAISLANEKGGQLFEDLVKKGKDFESKVKDNSESTQEKMTEVRKMAEKYGKTLESAFDEKLKNVIQKIGIPTREEISILARRVETLMANVEEILSRQKGKSGPKNTHPSDDPSGSK